MESANKLRESLQKSQAVTDAMLNVLGSFDRRLSSLDSAMRPTKVNFAYPTELCASGSHGVLKST